MSMAACGADRFLSLVCHVLYAWCASCFFRKHLCKSQTRGNVFWGLLFISRMLMTAFLENRNIPYILYALCSHGLLIGLVMATFGGEREKKLLAAVLWETMAVLIWNFSESFLCCAGLVLNRMAAGRGEAVFVGTWAERGILLLTYGTGITAVSLLSKPLLPVFHDKESPWYLYMALPLGGIVLVTDFVNWGASNGIMVQDWEKYGLYENQLFSHGAMCIFTGLAMAASGLFVFGMDKIHREEKAREEYRCQVMYYQMIEEQYSQMERLRHDMKNHLIALGNLLENRQWERAEGYIKDMANLGAVGAGDEVTGSLVIDALLYHKRRRALEKGIAWKCDARLPEKSLIKEMDLCIIAGNILDNAVEACEKLEETPRASEGRAPWIQVSIRPVKKCLFLEVRNSVDRAQRQEQRESQKRTDKNHGLGLGNVRDAVASYHGAVHIQEEKDVFMISILLPLYEEASE